MTPTPGTPANPGSPSPESPGTPGARGARRSNGLGARLSRTLGVGPAAAAALINSQRLSRQMLLDTVANWTAIAGMTLVLGLSFTAGANNVPGIWLALMIVVGTLLGVMFWTSARAWRALPYLTMLVEQDPANAESKIAALIGRLPMQGPIRLLLYHRLVVLRYRQQRFGETIDLCHALLKQRFGRAVAVRPDLLLMLIDSSLKREDLVSAYDGLMELASYRLRLGEYIQRVALQTRYEVSAGFDRAAMMDLARKVELAELLPAAQCAMLHQVLAVAARRSGQSKLADWLETRAELLGGTIKSSGG